MKLRPYQEHAVSSTLQAFTEVDRCLGVMSTGGGKTIVMSKIAENCLKAGHRVLLLAHREELLLQAQDKFLKASGIYADVEKGSKSASRDQGCVIGSVQTMCQEKRLRKWPKNHFKLVMIDEAHRSLANTYTTVIEHNNESKLLGVTATPDRSDKQELGSLYDRITFDVGIADLVRQGFLSPIKVSSFPIEASLRKLKTVGGDYSNRECAHMLDPLLEDIAEAFVTRAKGRRPICFLPLVEMSQRFAEILTSHGMPAEHVDGNSEDRVSPVKRFESGETQALCNSMLWTEGFDVPCIDAVLPLRPTKSRSLYIQMIGRGTRIFEGKDNLVVYDPLWLHSDHKLIRSAHLVAESKEEAIQISKEIEDADYIPGLDNLEDLLEMRGSVLEERASKLREKLIENNKGRRGITFDAITYALDVMQSPESAEHQPSSEWESQAATGEQLKVLSDNGFDICNIATKGHASMLIDNIMARSRAGLASAKQVLFMKRLGVHDALSKTKEEAKKIIGMEMAHRNHGRNYRTRRASH